MIYLDNAATTKVYKEVIHLIEYYNEQMFFNPSALYGEGLKNTRDINSAREVIANAIACENAKEIIFTSGGSESNSMAIFSGARYKKGKILTSMGEHASVFNAFNELKTRGYNVDFVEIDKNGAVSLDSLKEKMSSDVTFCSFMHVNNETGAINNLPQISKIVKSISPECIIHSDGVQAFGKLSVDVCNLGVDMYSMSAHKIHASKGVGALYVKKDVKVQPLIFGGGQENGYRSGTENVAGICGFALAATKAISAIESNYQHMKNLRSTFLRILTSDLSNVLVNSCENSSPYIVNVSIENIKSEVLQHLLENDKILIGLGSACSSKQKSSRLLSNMGVREKYAEGTIRVSFSSQTTEVEVIYAANKIADYSLGLRKLMRR